MIQRSTACLLGILALLGEPAIASAQSSTAELAFARGRELLRIGNYVEACAAFEESQALAPEIETQFNIALCSEQLGKLAMALALHRELAQTGATPQRRAMSADLVAQLEARVPRLRLAVSVRGPGEGGGLPPGLVVRVGDVKVMSFNAHPIDLGTSRVVATAPGYQTWSGQVIATEEAAPIAVTIVLERAGTREAPPAPGPPARGPAPSPSPGSAPGTVTVVALVGGGLGLGAGATFGLLARSRWADAREACGGTTMCPTPELLARGNALADEARSRATIATIATIAGGGLVVGGVILWATAPRGAHGVAITPSVGASSATLTVVGRF